MVRLGEIGLVVGVGGKSNDNQREIREGKVQEIKDGNRIIK
jgi:hypothetical protein